MAWIFLIIAAAFETAWTYSVKFMKFNDLKQLKLTELLTLQHGLAVWGPFAGYVLFGIGNVYFFSLAIKQVPVATAYAVWTAVTLILIKFADVAVFHQRISWAEVFFLLLIMTGILGLKYYGTVAR